MTMISAIPNRRCDMVLDALRAEFGAVLAARIMEAEAADFLWDARVRERYLGQELRIEEDVEELSRIAIVSVLAGRWHTALCLVDGCGRPVELLWKRRFDEPHDAEAMFDRAV